MSEPSTVGPNHDPTIEGLISILLRTGVLLSFSLVVAGTVISFVANPEYTSDPDALDQVTGPDAPFPHTVRDVLVGAAHLQGQAIVAVGLLVLIATPVLRVAVSIALFAHARDRAFVRITSVVLALLLLSLGFEYVAG